MLRYKLQCVQISNLNGKNNQYWSTLFNTSCTPLCYMNHECVKWTPHYIMSIILENLWALQTACRQQHIITQNIFKLDRKWYQEILYLNWYNILYLTSELGCNFIKKYYNKSNNIYLHDMKNIWNIITSVWII